MYTYYLYMHAHTHILHAQIYDTHTLSQMAGIAEYADCISPPTSVLVYDTKQSDGETQVMLELWRMPSLPGLLWPGVVAPERFLSKDPIELFDI